MRPTLSDHLSLILDLKLAHIEEVSGRDCLAFYGPIMYPLDDIVRRAIEAIQDRKRDLLVVLHTPGGVVETVERMVDTLRHHYDDVAMVIPDRAMSAGTIFALSADRIFMDYFSRLGPIDPQIQNDGQLTPALSLLVQYERLIEKDRKGKLTTAEFALLQKQFNLGELHQFEQARDLSITLLRKWLAAYKFKDWERTSTRGIDVDDDMRAKRAEEIAKILNDVTKWHSHGRGISRSTLEDELNLQIDKLEGTKLADAVGHYHGVVVDYIQERNLTWNVHTHGYRF